MSSSTTAAASPVRSPGPGAGSFTVATSSPDRDSAFIDVGLNADVTHSVTLFTDYTTQAGQSDFFAQSVQAGVEVSF